VDPALLTTTEAVDPVFIFIIGVSLVLLAGITGTMIWFVIRYRRSRAPQPTSQSAGNLWLELLWTVLPTVLVLVMFYYGWAGYLTLRHLPPDGLPVTATARMWSWSFTYANGKTSPELYVPVGKPVVVTLVSLDVLHGFYIPAFRVKRDVVPDMKNQVWFVADRPGSYDLFCSVYCGTGHSDMTTKVEALPADKFATWLQQKQEAEGGASGKLDGAKLARERGCLACHSLDGSRLVGPTFKGLYHHATKVTRNGQQLTVTADDAYLKESILTPNAAIVDGYPPIMPTLPDLTGAEVEALVEFIEGVQ